MNTSVIIPIYNAEAYIKKSIRSVLGQTYSDFELILVDDGSTDSTADICDKFAEEDGRIRVIHKKNEGLICARITGIEAAKGKYIAFVDADDWIEEVFLERLVDSIESTDADIVISGYIVEIGERADTIDNLLAPGIYNREELETVMFPRMLCYREFYQFGILPYMWNKLFRKDLLIRCYTDIDTKIYDGEDVAIIYPYLIGVKRAVVIEDCMYHYRIHENSMTAKKGKKFYENVCRIYLHLNKQFRESPYYYAMLPQLNQYLKRMIWIGLSEEDRKKDYQFCFPFGRVEYKADIILYGAGEVGIRYYKQINRTNYCNIISWVDKRYCELLEYGIPVEKPDVISLKKFDYVVVAHAEKKVQEEIKAYLKELKVEENQIVIGE